MLQKVKVDTYLDGAGEEAREVKRVKVKFKLADKLGALVQPRRHHKLFTDKTGHTGKDGKAFVRPVTDRDRAWALAAFVAKTRGGYQDRRSLQASPALCGFARCEPSLIF